jgi:hypothetical protein
MGLVERERERGREREKEKTNFIVVKVAQLAEFLYPVIKAEPRFKKTCHV